MDSSPEKDAQGQASDGYFGGKASRSRRGAGEMATSMATHVGPSISGCISCLWPEAARARGVLGRWPWVPSTPHEPGELGRGRGRAGSRFGAGSGT